MGCRITYLLNSTLELILCRRHQDEPERERGFSCGSASAGSCVDCTTVVSGNVCNKVSDLLVEVFRVGTERAEKAAAPPDGFSYASPLPGVYMFENPTRQMENRTNNIKG